MIPRIIHQFWTGPEMSKAHQDNCAELQAMNPTWEYKFNTGEQPLKFLNYLYVDAHHFSSRPNVFRANLVRYEALYIDGGISIDVDKKPIRPLDTLLAKLDDSDVIVATNGLNPDPGVLGASSRNPFIAQLIELASQQTRNPYLGVQGCEHLATILAKNPLIPVLPSHFFYPRTSEELQQSILCDSFYLRTPNA